ncbi:MAG: hypothetical protein OXK17_08370 [Thaumarchaeota archaeon]|nr:hypothetical protein [Nitrososphaerota archaeon]
MADGKNPYPRMNRIVPTDIPATRCAKCGHVWRNSSKPRANRTMCPKCSTVNPEHFAATTIKGHKCLACDKSWFSRSRTISRGNVRCPKCGSYESVRPGWSGK